MTGNQPLAGRTALVTGGGVGIGEGIALALAERGARVAITYLTHEPDAAFVRRFSGISGSDPLALHLDATDEADVTETARRVTTAFGGLDILVNNAGGLVRRSQVAAMDYELWRRVLALNLDSLFLVTHHLLPAITENGGRVINVASLAGRNGGHPGAAAYATAKAGVLGFTRALARELAPRGITVNALAPGFIEATPFHDTFTTPESKAATLATIPAGRAGVPADVAGAAAWLALPETSFVTGAVIDINGGQYFA